MGTAHPTLRWEDGIHLLTVAVQLSEHLPASTQAHPLRPGLSLRWGRSQLTDIPAFYLPVMPRSPLSLPPPTHQIFWNPCPFPPLTAPCLCTLLTWVHPRNLSSPAPMSTQGHSYPSSAAEKHFISLSRWRVVHPCCLPLGTHTSWSAPLPLSRDSRISEAAVWLL